jgi:hypothetical protein
MVDITAIWQKPYLNFNPPTGLLALDSMAQCPLLQIQKKPQLFTLEMSYPCAA